MRFRAALATMLAVLALAASTSIAFADTPAKGPAGQLSNPQPAPGAESGKQAPASVNGAVSPSAAEVLTPPLAVRGGDNQMWVSTPNGWVSYGGVLAGAPAVVVVPAPAAGGQPETLYVVTGSDHALWVRSDSRGWARLASFYTYANQGPAAAVTPSSDGFVLTVGVKGGDNALWVLRGPITSTTLPLLTSAAVSWGGYLQGQPAALTPAGIPSFYVTGGDGHVWWRQEATSWQQFSTLQCFGHPAAGQAGNGLQVVTCWGFDNTLWFVTGDATGWAAARTAGGILTEDLAVRPLSDNVYVDVGGGGNTIWQATVSAAGASPYSQISGLITPSDEPGYRLWNVPVYRQSMPLDCETAVMQMALTALGHWYSQSALFGLEGADNRRGYWSGSVLRWGNPYQHFVGSVYGSESAYTGWGIFYPPLLSIAHSHGAPGSYAGEGFSAGQIYAALAAGHPVQVWVEYNWVRPRMGSWLTFDGSRWIRYSTWEHSVLLIGVSAGGVLVNDPGTGRQYWVSRDTFQTSWGDYNNMALVYG